MKACILHILIDWMLWLVIGHCLRSKSKKSKQLSALSLKGAKQT